MIKSFKYRLFTNRTQEAKLNSLLDSARFLYNCALEHRIISWKQWRKSISYYDQTYSLKEVRKSDEATGQLNFTCCINILRHLDKAFQAFFNRMKKGEEPSFPRFKGKDRFHSLPYRYGDGIKLKNGKLYIQNVGHIRIKLHRELEGKIKTATVKRQSGRFYISFACDEVPLKALPTSNKEIGIDVGIKSFAVMSDGQVIDNPKHLKQSESKLKELQHQHSKKRTKNTRRKFSRLHEKVHNQRKDFLHKLSRKIVNSFGFIFVEDLNIKNMLKNNHKVLNKYTSDAAWSLFFNYTSYKAEWAGRMFVKVDPKGTTQECFNCGEIVKKDLSVRIHNCPKCGFKVSRDYNSSLNILRRGHRLCFMQEAISLAG